ncbi:MAG: 6-bladed beta-propeller [Lunatimonas sp.]|uniref:6-bladed beta-propeller n=1 Tax=Lunatimonas sp. TaxID=2060141 RepID=UPI00263B1545|nr:6-bladed beta-propeller [Lunatimonas sp.]MCC5939874.1 6-bladed beta-propeller [Lunatimonas sp.]
MRVIRFSLYLSILIAVCTSCESSPKTADRSHIELFKVKEERLPLEIKELIPLETTPDNLLSAQSDVRFWNDGFLIWESQRRGDVHHFLEDGSYAGKVLEVGEGPDKVARISHLLRPTSDLEILTGQGMDTELIRFPMPKDTPESTTLGVLGFSAEWSPSGRLAVYAGHNLPVSDHRLYLLDEEGGIVSRFLENDYSNEMMPITGINLYPFPNKLFFHDSFDPVIYEVVGDTIAPYVTFDFGRMAIPSEFWEEDLMEAFMKLNERGFADVYRMHDSESYSLFEIYVQSMEGVENHQILLDKSTNSVKKQVFHQHGSHVLYQPVGFRSDRELVFLVEMKTLKSGVGQMELAPGLREQLEGWADDDNPVLIVAALR